MMSIPVPRPRQDYDTGPTSLIGFMHLPLELRRMIFYACDEATASNLRRVNRSIRAEIDLHWFVLSGKSMEPYFNGTLSLSPLNRNKRHIFNINRHYASEQAAVDRSNECEKADAGPQPLVDFQAAHAIQKLVFIDDSLELASHQEGCQPRVRCLYEALFGCHARHAEGVVICKDFFEKLIILCHKLPNLKQLKVIQIQRTKNASWNFQAIKTNNRNETISQLRDIAILNRRDGQLQHHRNRIYCVDISPEKIRALESDLYSNNEQVELTATMQQCEEFTKTMMTTVVSIQSGESATADEIERTMETCEAMPMIDGPLADLNRLIYWQSYDRWLCNTVSHISDSISKLQEAHRYIVEGGDDIVDDTLNAARWVDVLNQCRECLSDSIPDRSDIIKGLDTTYDNINTPALSSSDLLAHVEEAIMRYEHNLLHFPTNLAQNAASQAKLYQMKVQTRLQQDPNFISSLQQQLDGGIPSDLMPRRNLRLSVYPTSAQGLVHSAMQPSFGSPYQQLSSTKYRRKIF
ncbi:hypothetical protein BT63DRAFT_475454 [Microthyrium microscopicum]|uniref:Uncharacterized protein n=1 Tax=Microthyrium microscopicum TaxID=703497 RepID=A0A6A6UKT0_9PEZI|nr:hypothetical protein BT63DRAFT_475454 [Microthyrium microscopicum]